MKIENGNFEGYSGATAGQSVEDRWQYEGVGYNATDGIFYVGTDEAKELSITPFAIRQCKEVVDANGVTHRYPIKTRRAEMAEGDVTNRVQVVGLVGGELHIFGARSWTARAAWLNPRGGQWHDDRFEVGIWFRLQDYIKEVKTQKSVTTVPLCYELRLAPGESIELSSAADSKKKSKGCPIKVVSLSFVGAEQAAANERLFVDECIDEWVAEWNKAAAVTEAAPEADHAPVAVETPDELIPF